MIFPTNEINHRLSKYAYFLCNFGIFIDLNNYFLNLYLLQFCLYNINCYVNDNDALHVQDFIQCNIVHLSVHILRIPTITLPECANNKLQSCLFSTFYLDAFRTQNSKSTKKLNKYCHNSTSIFYAQNSTPRHILFCQQIYQQIFTRYKIKNALFYRKCHP